MSLDSAVGKKYILESSENFDEYMKAIGVNMMIRKVANSMKPVVELTKSGDEWSLSSVTSFKSSVTKFKDGAEFEQDTPDGRKVTSKFTINGSTVLEVQTDSKGKKSSIERTFSGDEIKMVMKVDDIVCTRIYKLQ